MTAVPVPTEAARSTRPGRYDVLALAAFLASSAVLLLVRRPEWTLPLAASVALGGLGVARRRWLHAGLAAVGAVWIGAAAWRVLLASTWTLDDTLAWGAALVGLGATTWASVAVRNRLRRLEAELIDTRAFAAVATVHDPLTGLANRKGLAMLAGQILESARRRGDAVYCVFVDVDGLAKVNSDLGHEAGDEVLLGVAEAITQSTRATDAVARWGDDEFVVIGPGTGLAPLEIERRVRARCIETSTIDRSIWAARISAGGAVLEPWDEGDVDSLLRLADREMHVRRTLRREAAVPAYQPVRHDPSPRPPDSRKTSGWPE